MLAAQSVQPRCSRLNPQSEFRNPINPINPIHPPNPVNPQ